MAAHRLRDFLDALYDLFVDYEPAITLYIDADLRERLTTALLKLTPPISLEPLLRGILEFEDTTRRVLSQISSGDAFHSPILSEQDEELLDRVRELERKLAVLVQDTAYESLAALVEAVGESADQIKQVQQDVEEAAGITATDSLSIHFDNYAKSQTWTMWGLRVVGALLLALAFWVARSVVFGSEAPLTWDAEVARLPLTVPILFLAYYSLREAGHHRDASQRAKENAVRLKTVRAYTDEMPDEQKLKLRYELGQRVFTEKAPGLIDADIDAKDATSLLGAITALLGVAKK